MLCSVTLTFNRTKKYQIPQAKFLNISLAFLFVLLPFSFNFPSKFFVTNTFISRYSKYHPAELHFCYLKFIHHLSEVCPEFTDI